MMTKRDYYEILGVARTARRRRAEGGLRKLAMELPSGPQSRRQGLPSTVQGNQRGLRRPEGRRRSARPTTASATPPSRSGMGGGGARLRRRLRLDLRRHLRRHLRRLMGGAARPQRRPRARRDLRYNLEITLEEAFAGKTAQITVPTSVACEACAGIGRQARHQAEDLPAPATATARCAPARASSPSSAPARPARAAAR